MLDLTGQWKGIIIFGPEYGDMEGKELYFSAAIIQDKDTFKGIARDTGEGSNPDKASLSGFIDGLDISFVKQYYSDIRIDENNNVDLEKKNPGPEITYWGTFDPLTNSFEGDWEIRYNAKQLVDGWLELVATGTWTMCRV